MACYCPRIKVMSLLNRGSQMWGDRPLKERIIEPSKLVCWNSSLQCKTEVLGGTCVYVRSQSPGSSWWISALMRRNQKADADFSPYPLSFPPPPPPPSARPVKHASQKKMAPTRTTPYWHADLGPWVSRTIVSIASSMGLCSCSLHRQRQMQMILDQHRSLTLSSSWRYHQHLEPKV